MFGEYYVLLQQDQLENPQTTQFGDYPCHIYMIARRPRIMLDPKSIKFGEKIVTGNFNIQRGENLESHTFSVPNNMGTSKVKIDCPYPYTEFFMYDFEGKELSKGKSALLITSFGIFWELLSLEILYIGQSYGSEGDRTALERLKNHSTLQGIYSEAIRRSPDKEIWLLLWNFETHLITAFDPTQDTYATTNEEDNIHINKVLTTGITEQQQINFAEAALIRYFQPEYNVLFKNSFPNPAHKTYSECYDLDINFLAVELQTYDILTQIWSPSATARWEHKPRFLLHSREERKAILDALSTGFFEN